MSYNPTNENPYSLIRPYAIIKPGTLTRRISCRVPIADWSLFASLYPVPGAMESILTTLIHGIATEFRNAGLTSWSTPNQCQFIAHIRRCAALGLVRVPVPRTDSGESESVGGAAPDAEEEPTETEQQDD